MVLGSPKPEEVPLSWIQPETIVLNCSHDLLSGKCVKIGAGPLVKNRCDCCKARYPYSKEYVPEMFAGRCQDACTGEETEC